jgi:hypothetical protein
MDVELNKNGVNAKIKANILSDAQMRKIGFTDYCEDKWFFFKMLKGVDDISFSLTISKSDVADFRIDVLDENFCQPYDYQSMLERNPSFKYALKVKEQVEHWMKHLHDNGVISGHEYGEYI